MRYINKVKSRHGIGIPAVCGYQNFGEKIVFNVRAMFSQSYFFFPILYNILYNCLNGHFNILPFLYTESRYSTDYQLLTW